MKTRVITAFLLVVLALSAQTALDLDVPITQGNVTMQCQYVDFSGWAPVFRLSSGFRCLIATTSPGVSKFDMTINTGLHQYSIAGAGIQSGYSIVSFPTQDRQLFAVSITERRDLEPVNFGSPQPKIEQPQQ